ncbi:hypothetical protein AABC73_18950 [Pseudomonas sp. G.S.17]|uniref:hypothetical protein n=1 Tax=Pseudomonas sp. G.S.17 TaxID=3137451 RepID=UPI00311CAE55
MDSSFLSGEKKVARVDLGLAAKAFSNTLRSSAIRKDRRVGSQTKTTKIQDKRPGPYIWRTRVCKLRTAQ